jgi:hypothetical protein
MSQGEREEICEREGSFCGGPEVEGKKYQGVIGHRSGLTCKVKVTLRWASRQQVIAACKIAQAQVITE